MKTLARNLPAVFFLAATITGCSSAGYSKYDYNYTDINHTVTSTSVRFRVDDNGVATLTGTVESHSDRYRLARAAARLEGVTKVRNHLATSD